MTTLMKLKQSLYAALACATCFAALMPAVLAQAVESGMADRRIADRHATLAAGAAQLSDVRLHLQHVLNCLEGP